MFIVCVEYNAIIVINFPKEFNFDNCVLTIQKSQKNK